MPFALTTLWLGLFVLIGLWLIDQVGIYLKWTVGCLLSMLLVAGGIVLLILLHDFLRDF